MSDKRLAKLQEAQAKLQAQRESQLDAMYDNEAVVMQLATRMNREQNINKLKDIYAQLEQIPVERLPVIGEVRVTPYAVEPGMFGEELSLVLGLVTTLDMLFVEEQIDLAYAIVNGTTSSEVEDIVTALGRPVRFSKRTATLTEELPGNYELAINQLQLFANNIGLNMLDTTRFSETAYNAWFTKSKKRAEDKLEEINKIDALTSSEVNSKLTIE